MWIVVVEKQSERRVQAQKMGRFTFFAFISLENRWLVVSLLRKHLKHYSSGWIGCLERLRHLVHRFQVLIVQALTTPIGLVPAVELVKVKRTHRGAVFSYEKYKIS